jgi:hypothetical protein
MHSCGGFRGGRPTIIRCDGTAPRRVFQSRHHRPSQENDTLSRPFIPALAAVSVLFALSGCELLKRNEEVTTLINARVLGKPAGEFFDRYGPASVRREAVDNSTWYDWISDLGYAPPGFAGREERYCKLRLIVDKGGRVSAVEVLFDAPGLKSTSRCGEIFAAK